MLDKALVESRRLSLAMLRVQLLFWLRRLHTAETGCSAMPITLCGLRLDDEMLPVAIGLRLGLNLFVPHTCR